MRRKAPIGCQLVDGKLVRKPSGNGDKSARSKAKGETKQKATPKRNGLRRVSPTNSHRRNDPAVRLAMRACIEEAGYCEKCGTSERLTAHHLMPQGKYQLLRAEPLNLLCLCVDCHDWVQFTVDGQRWEDSNYSGRKERLRLMDGKK